MAKERPILFTTEMVNAILRGTKTMTRREIKPQPRKRNLTVGDDVVLFFDRDGSPKWHRVPPAYPFGIPGALLWVRESHFVTWTEDQIITVKYNDGRSKSWYYKQLPLRLLQNLRKRKSLGKSWVSGRFLPKEFARIWLGIVDTQAEPLQDISEEDAKAEGIEMTWKHDDINRCKWKNYINEWKGSLGPCESFYTLWMSINGYESYDSNPWVWAISFKVLSTTGKPLSTDEKKEVAHV